MSINTGLEVFLDIFFVNKLAFLVSVRKRLKFTAIKYIPNSSEKE